MCMRSAYACSVVKKEYVAIVASCSQDPSASSLILNPTQPLPHPTAVAGASGAEEVKEEMKAVDEDEEEEEEDGIHWNVIDAPCWEKCVRMHTRIPSTCVCHTHKCTHMHTHMHTCMCASIHTCTLNGSFCFALLAAGIKTSVTHPGG